MKWTEVPTVLDPCTTVTNFLDGILVNLPSPYDGTFYVQGWEVVEPSGDMDGPALRRRPSPAPPSYQYILAPILGEIGR